MTSPGKIPSNATKISLHERFSTLRGPTRSTARGGAVQRVRQNVAQLQAASSKNRRLAQLMEKRLASKNIALKLKKKSIKLRLGEATTVSNGGLRGRGASRGTIRGVSRGKLRGARAAPVRGRATTTVQRGTITLKQGKSRGVLKAQAKNVQGSARQLTPQKKMKLKRNIPSAVKVQVTPAKPGRGRGGKALRGRGGRGAVASRAVNNPPPTRGQKSPRGRPTRGGRGGRGRGDKKPSLTREDLDKQLDQYMSGTKHTLDQELDSYMKVAGDAEMK